jgi:hypothetical protein
MKTIYKNYIIEEETEPWAVIIKMIFRYYPIGESVGEGTMYASSIQEAKDEIDEIIVTQ